MHEDALRALLQGSFETRAIAYANLFDVLREEFGAARAVELMRTAIRRMGEAAGRRLAGVGPGDLAGVRDAFLASVPDAERLFAPEVEDGDGETVICMRRCPLLETWRAAGRDDADIAALCRIASGIDEGMFAAAGFAFAGETWRPGASGCCTLRVRPGPPRPPASRDAPAVSGSSGTRPGG